MKALTLGKPVDREELKGLFNAPEGILDLVYGPPRNGKTTHEVRIIMDSLEQGIPVYSNINLDFSKFNFDDRLSLRHTFWNFLLFRKRYYSFNKSNFHWIDTVTKDSLYRIYVVDKKTGKGHWELDLEKLVSYLKSLTDCVLVWDEAQRLMPSYVGTSLDSELMDLCLTTGHFNRRIVFATQRPTALHVQARGNMNRFFKCKKLLSWPVVLLRVWEFVDMKADTVDEDRPVAKHLYISNRKVFSAFNTHYLRGGVPRSQEVFVEAKDLNFTERLIALLGAVVRAFRRGHGHDRGEAQ